MNAKSKMNKELLIVMDDEPMKMTEKNKHQVIGTPFYEIFESLTTKEASETILYAYSKLGTIVVARKGK